MKISRGASLDRYYLLKLFGFGVFLHRIHHSDPPNLYHSHPWSGLSIIFGSYEEAYPGKDFVRKRFFNWIRATQHHCVRINTPVWTIFIHLPRSNQWSIADENGIIGTEPWRGAEGFKDYAK